MIADIRNKKILLVEDHQFIINVIHDLLTSVGFKDISKAYNAESALEMMESTRFDMIITDVEMGDMNGIEMLKLIRTGKTPQPVDTRVLVLTSHASASVLGTAIALDANGFLVKPAKLNSTVDKIKDAFEEDFVPRRPIGYSVIPTEVIDTEEEPKEEKERKESVDDLSKGFVIGGKKENEGRATTQKMVTDVEEGMVTATSIKNKKGMVLIPADQHLTKSNINRLMELRDQLADDFVRIYE
jgi:DNA-binding NarL/FixJ family response regulator